MPKSNVQLLSHLQKRILLIVGKHHEIDSDRLASLMETYCSRHLGFDDWRCEIEMECQLFSLRGILHLAPSSNGSIVYTASRRLSEWVPKRPTLLSPVYKWSKKYKLKRIPFFLFVSSLALSGCSSLSWPHWPEADPSTTVSKGLPPVPRYNAEGWLPPERMEQFNTPGKGAVYRFCTNDCPVPTKKLPLKVTPGAAESTHTNYDAVTAADLSRTTEVLTSLRHELAMESTVAEAEAFLRDHPVPSKAVKKTPVEPEAPSVRSGRDVQLPQVPSASVKASPPVVVANTGDSSALRNKPVVVDKEVKKKNSVATAAAHAHSSGRVLFAGNQEVLSESGRKAIADLVDVAKSAESIRLRGYAGRVDSEAEFNKLSIARALAVRAELVKSGIVREKIKILNPKYQPDNPTASTNRSVVLTFTTAKTPAQGGA